MQPLCDCCSAAFPYPCTFYARLQLRKWLKLSMKRVFRSNSLLTLLAVGHEHGGEVKYLIRVVLQQKFMANIFEVE